MGAGNIWKGKEEDRTTTRAREEGCFGDISESFAKGEECNVSELSFYAA